MARLQNRLASRPACGRSGCLSDTELLVPGAGRAAEKAEGRAEVAMELEDVETWGDGLTFR